MQVKRPEPGSIVITQAPDKIATVTAWQQVDDVSVPRAEGVDVWLVPLQSDMAGSRVRAGKVQTGKALRRILARYTGVEPDALCIQRRAEGKPYLTGCPGAPFFNLSHTRGCSLIAVSDATEVGVDVEQSRPSIDIPAIATRMFDPETAEALRQLSDPDRTTAFLQLWTRFEATQKAMGRGIFATPVGDADVQVSTFRISQDTIASVAVVSDHPVQLRHFRER